MRYYAGVATVGYIVVNGAQLSYALTLNYYFLGSRMWSYLAGQAVVAGGSGCGAGIQVGLAGAWHQHHALVGNELAGGVDGQRSRIGGGRSR